MKGPGDVSAILRGCISKAWYVYGVFAVQWPWLPVLLGVVLTLLCLTGYGRLETETVPENLFYIQHGKAWDEFEMVKEVFQEDVKGTAVYFEISDAGVANAMSSAVLTAVFELHRQMLEVTGARGSTLSDWCWRASPSAPCFATNAFFALNITTPLQCQSAIDSGSLITAFTELQHIVTLDGVGQALMLRYIYDLNGHSSDDYRDWADEWEQNAYEEVLNYRSPYFTARPMNSRLAVDRTNELSKSVMPLMLLAVIVVVGFVTTIISGKPCVQSRILLGCTTVITVLLSMACAYGVAGLVGIKQNPATVLMLFVLLGVGVDDIIIVIHSCDGLKRRIPALTNRLPEGLRNSGLAITLTTLTTTIAFFSASFVPLGMASSVSLFGMIAFLALYIIQGSFFLGIFIYDERRREASRLDGLCCFKGAAGSAQVAPRATPAPNAVTSDRRMSVRRKRWRRYGEVLTSGPGIVASLSTWIIFTAVTCAYLPQVSTEFDLKSYYPEGDPMREALVLRETYYDGIDADMYIYIDHSPMRFPNGTGRFLNPQELGALDRCYDKVQQENWVQALSPILGRAERDWTEAFQLWLSGPGISSQVLPYNQRLATFLNAPPFPISPSALCPLGCIQPSNFMNSIVLDGDGFPRWSRVGFKVKYPSSGPVAIERRSRAMQIYRDNSSPLRGFIFTSSFIGAERDENILGELILSLGMTCAIVAAMLCILLDIISGIFVAICIVLLDLSILGCLTAMGKPLTVVVFLMLTMVIGMCVDYVVHTCHDFLKEFRAGEQATESVVKVIESTGRWVGEGAFSTLAGLAIPAIFAPSEAAATFGVTMCLAIIFGLTYGLVWAPTFMYLFAVAWQSMQRLCKSGRDSDSSSSSSEEGDPDKKEIRPEELNRGHEDPALYVAALYYAIYELSKSDIITYRGDPAKPQEDLRSNGLTEPIEIANYIDEAKQALKDDKDKYAKALTWLSKNAHSSWKTDDVRFSVGEGQDTSPIEQKRPPETSGKTRTAWEADATPVVVAIT